jgi:hypothetical protein
LALARKGDRPVATRHVKNRIAAAILSGVLIAALSVQAVRAAKVPSLPWPGCRLASKLEYQSAKRQYLLRNRVGEYVRTGRFWRRAYCYCPG